MYYLIALSKPIVELWCHAKNFPNAPRILLNFFPQYITTYQNRQTKLSILLLNKKSLYSQQLGVEKVPTIKAEENWTKEFPQQEMNWSQLYQNEL